MRAVAFSALLCVVLISSFFTPSFARVQIKFGDLFNTDPSGDDSFHAPSSTNQPASDLEIDFSHMFNGVEFQTTSTSTSNTVDCNVKGAYNFEIDETNANRYGPFVSTLPGACRNSGELGRVTTCVRPGGTVDVQVRVKNTGMNAFDQTTTLSLVTNSDAFPYWQQSTLRLIQPIAPRGSTVMFAGVLHAPTAIGKYFLQWVGSSPCGSFGNVTTSVEVTCSDGNFCNGMERYVNHKCVSAARPQCDDQSDCTIDTCDEELMLCTHKIDEAKKATDKKCTTCKTICAEGEVCEGHCFEGQECGFDGFGGKCGAGCSFDKACQEGKCVVPQSPGSCAAPFTLVKPGEPLLGRHVIELDNSVGVNEVVPTCNTESTATELIYQFEIPEGLGYKVGIDARFSNVSSELDTILELRQGRCADYDPNGAEQFKSDGLAKNVWCSDDATPPGGVGSHVTALLGPGTYYLVCDGYSTLTVGPAVLDVRFTRDYVPKCLSRFCGDDGHGGDCGPCEADETCSPTKKCIKAECSAETKCLNGTAICGDDGCGLGGTCGPLNGACPPGLFCLQREGRCTSFDVCDHLKPTCKSPCTVNQYCGVDCECHDLDYPMPDLTIDYQNAVDSVIYAHVNFDNASCAWKEACIDATGIRRVMRFDTTVINQGDAPLIMPTPAERPDEFFFASCHNHYHYQGFAEYRLLKGDEIIRRGHKQAYCLEDSIQYPTQEGPEVPCRGSTECEHPGLSRGWMDVYGHDLDCQWIDITDLPPGPYTLRMDINTARQLQESTHENNHVEFTVNIPPVQPEELENV